jgi:hypothetical protein
MSKRPSVFRMLREMWHDFRHFGVQEYRHIDEQGRQILKARDALRQSKRELADARTQLMQSVQNAASAAKEVEATALRSLVEQRAAARNEPPPAADGSDVPPDQRAAMADAQRRFDEHMQRPDSLVARVLRQRAADLVAQAARTHAAAQQMPAADAELVRAVRQFEQTQKAAELVSGDAERLQATIAGTLAADVEKLQATVAGVDKRPK